MLMEPPPTRADMHLRMLRLPVRVSPWFWLFGLVSGWDNRQLDFVLAWIGVLFVSILVHELGHALVARFFGARDGRIVLYGFGGLAINSGGLKRWQRILESLAGPGAGFLLYGLVWAAARFVLSPETMSPLAVTALHDLEWICFWWGIVNLLPVYPLDGGQIAHELFQWRRPYDGLILAFRFSVVASIIVTAGFVYLYWTNVYPSTFPFFMFAFLGVNNFLALRALRQGGLGAEMSGLDAGRREAWERDPDWWKGS